MLQEWQIELDPNEANWIQTPGSPVGWFTNKATGKKYNPSHGVQWQLDKQAEDFAKAGKGSYIPGFTPLPDEYKDVPITKIYEEMVRREQEAAANNPETNTPPTSGGGSNSGGSNGGSQSGGGGNPLDYYLPGLTGGSTWNPGVPGNIDPFDKGNSSTSGQQKWNPGAPSSGGGMERTGTAMEFKPFGTVEDYSSEILRYGGPMSGQSGRWEGIEAPDMVEVGGTTKKPTRSATAEFNPNMIQAPIQGGGYQNIILSPDDGKVWTDPKTGQTYVWQNDKWQKADLKDRLGPTTPGPTVTNTGGTGTEDDPIDLILSGSSDPTAALRLQAQILRNNQ
jgi:hypothetical protein